MRLQRKKKKEKKKQSGKCVSTVLRAALVKGDLWRGACIINFAIMAANLDCKFADKRL